MLPAVARLLRPSHWVKNVFVLAPLVFAEKLTDPASLTSALLAFLVFCGASSTVYVFNDILDREEDRRHPLKRHRPVASGAVPVPAAAALAALLAAGSLAGALLASPAVAAVAAVYLLLNLAYSARLKHVVILDVMIISLGFLLRVLAGAEAIRVELSAWLLLCTLFLSLFLAFSKRRHELILLNEAAAGQRPVLSHYSPAFLDQMTNVVTASTVIAYALYCVAPETVARFGTGALVYTVPFVLFGVFRYLYLIYQTRSPRNPTEAVLSDLPSLANLLLWVFAVTAIVYR
ncbi:MAG: decaprenyl-phosphate phosphoribosyltransferase [Thermoanaerobaculia bacterium]|nr:decaprenyl-phosphate phosphoribosyltransferase [Thermoanaerobaculia bacterium]